MELDKRVHAYEAIKEARRCLGCAQEFCRRGCPLDNHIPQFIRDVREGNFGSAYAALLTGSTLPAICSRVCPHERLCEEACVLGQSRSSVRIGTLERFVADFAQEQDLQPLPASTGEKGRVAVIGSGPSGLAVASTLAKLDFAVTVFEAQDEPGGVLLFGIPGFRLNKEVVKREIHQITHLGVEIKTGVRVGDDITLDEMFDEGFDAIFIGTGTYLPRTLDIPGKDLSGIITGTYFMQTAFLADEGELDASEAIIRSGSDVVVVGAGNVGVEAARMALKRGARRVTLVYRKTQAEVSADRDKYEQAVAEGVRFKFLRQPIAYLNKKQMRALKAERHDPDPDDETVLAGVLLQDLIKKEDGTFSSGKGQEYLTCDTLILAIGSRSSAKFILDEKAIELDKEGHIITRDDPCGMTTRTGVFSSGDMVKGTSTVVYTMQEAKKVAEGIARYVSARRLMAKIDQKK